MMHVRFQASLRQTEDLINERSGDFSLAAPLKGLRGIE
jgi:hypothetical protein